MGKQKEEKKGGAAGDPRFAAVAHDPRFQRFPKAKAKVQVDDRFKSMFHDPAFKVGVSVDKRGRKVKTKGRHEDMRKYYHLKDEDIENEGAAAVEEREGGAVSEEEAQEAPAKAAKQKRSEKRSQGKAAAAKAKKASAEEEDEESEEESSEEEENLDADPEATAAALRWARMRGLAGPDTSSSDEDDSGTEEDGSRSEDGLEKVSGGGSGDSGSEEEESGEEGLPEAVLEEWGVGALAANPMEEIMLLPDATARLACIDLDWEHVRAVDILVALRSFVPVGGVIRRVTVYPSDYGLQRMAEEASTGPRGIWRQRDDDSGAARSFSGSDSDDGRSGGEEERAEGGPREEEEENGGGIDSGSGSEGESGSEAAESDEGDGDGAVDPARLRLYERSKLRWHYAIVECDSAATANKLYEECDDMELMKTACKFDLRFVPDDQSFVGRQVRDAATDVPVDYDAPVFQTKALQHTNVELTWDKGDEGRKQALSKKLTADEIKEDDFKAYLATESEGGSSSGDEEDAQAVDAAAEKRGEGGHRDAEALRQRYRKLLLGGDQGEAPAERVGKKDWNGAGGKGGGSDNGEEEEEEGERNGGGGGSGDERKMEMQVTFVPGLDGLGERLMAKRREAEAKKGETLWEAYLRRKREKKAEAKRKGKVNVDSDDEEDTSGGEASGSSDDEDVLPAGVADDPFFQHDPTADPFDDPFFNSGPADAPGLTGDAPGKKKGKKESAGKKGKKRGNGGGSDEEDEERRQQRAQLEMLLMDEGSLLRRGAGPAAAKEQDAGGGLGGGKKLSKKERMRQKKERVRAERAQGSDDEDHEEAAGAGFKVNLDDPRFESLYAGPEFALDPTDPRFLKAGAGGAVIAAEAARRRGKKRRQQEKSGEGKAPTEGPGKAAVEKKERGSGGGKADLRLMVASLKRKAAMAAPEGKKKAAKRG